MEKDLNDPAIPSLSDRVETNVKHLSDFARRSRAFGQTLERLEVDRGRQAVDPEDREAMRQWILEARDHTTDPEALSADAVSDARPLDYVVMAQLFGQFSELIRDVE
jgi:hypothetical protein